MTTIEKPTTGQVEERSAPEAAELTIEGNQLRGLVPYGVESRDLGGWSEVIERGALTHADEARYVRHPDHDASRLLGRFDCTLTVEDRSDGLAWSVELPNGPTGQDVKEAVTRGDLNQSSWRMVVGRDRWDGTVRHIEEVRELKDVADVTTSAYPAESTRVELRERPQEPHDPPKPPAAEGAQPKENEMEHDRENTAAGLRSRTGAPSPRGPEIESRLLDEMRAVPTGRVPRPHSRGRSRSCGAADAEYVRLGRRATSQIVLLGSGVPVVPPTGRARRPRRSWADPTSIRMASWKKSTETIPNSTNCT